MDKPGAKPRIQTALRAAGSRVSFAVGKAAAGAGGAFKNGALRGAFTKILLFAAHFGAGFLMSRTAFFGEYMPFGAAFCAACCKPPGTAGAFLGAAAGYALNPAADMPKYFAVLLLILAAVFVLRNILPLDGTVFPPVAAGTALFLAGAVYVAGQGVNARNVMLGLTEAMTGAGGAYFFRIALTKDNSLNGEHAQRRTVCIFLLAAVILASLAPFEPLPGVSAGRTAAALLILTCAARSGVYGGAVGGAILGLTMDLYGGSGLFYTASFAFSGLCAGIFMRAGRLATAFVFVIVNAAAVFWNGGILFELPSLYETLFAAFVFLFLPERTLALIRTVRPPPTQIPDRGDRMKKYISGRLTRTAAAFRELQDVISLPPRDRDRNDANAATLFTGAAADICKNCADCDVCWNREYNDTKDMLNSAVPKILKKGRADRSDFPARFTSRCRSLGEFTAEVNRGLYSSLCRKRYLASLDESRELLCGQYGDISRLLEENSIRLSSDLRFDGSAERGISRYLARYGLDLSALVYADRTGRCSVEIEGPDLSPLIRDISGTSAAFSRITGKKIILCEQECEKGMSRLFFRERDNYTCSVGASAAKKLGSEVSGDCGTYFKTGDGRICIILSDGTGSGREAAVESAWAVRLLEKFLRAGLDADLAVRIVSSALFLRGEDGMRATLDILCISLLNGTSTFYKCGAAASYVLKSEGARRISPAPVSDSPSREKTAVSKFILREGETVLMLTDGVLGDDDDAWLLENAADETGDLKELAAALIAKSPHNGIDDMTAVALRLIKNA